MGKKKGKGKPKGQTPSDDQPPQPQPEPQPTTSQPQPEPPQPEPPKEPSGDQPQQQQSKKKKGKAQQKGPQGGPPQQPQQPVQPQQQQPPVQPQQQQPPPQFPPQQPQPPQQFAAPQPQQQAWRPPQQGRGPQQQPWGPQHQQGVPPQRFAPPQQGPPGFAPPQRFPPGFQQPVPPQGPPGVRHQSPVRQPPPGQYGGPQYWQAPQQAMGFQQQQPGPRPQQQQQPGPRPQQPQQQPGPRPQQPQQQPGPRPQQQQPGPRPQQQQQQPGPRPQQQQQQQPGPRPQQPQQQPGPRPQQQQPGPRPQQPGFHQQQPGPRPQQQQPQGPPPQQPQQPQGPRQPPPGRHPQQSQTPPQQQQRGGPSRMPPEQQPQQAPPSLSPPSGQGDCLRQLIPVQPGTKGRKIRVESNHLALNLGKILQAVHYDVTITPDTPKALLRDVMNLFRDKHYKGRYPAFDGRKNLYTPTKLPFGDTISDKIKIEGENRTKEFMVEIKFARTVDLSPLHDMLRSKKSPQDALQCLDIVLRNAPSNNCIIAGRCFFTPPRDAIIPLGEGMEMYYGFYQSAIRGWKPLLNVDVAHKAFPKALELLDLICELGSDYRFTMERKDLRGRIHDNVLKSVEKFIKQLKVKYEIKGQSSSKRIYRVNGFGDSPSQARFKLEDGTTTTVEKYFENVKRVKLAYPHLPTVWVGAKDRENKILLPLEYCMLVEGQTVNRKMTENQTSAMIKKSATSTDIRKQKIMKSLDEVRYNNDPCIREFGFSVNNQFERLDARVLEPPTLKYKNDATVKPSRGVWRADRHKFLVGATIRQWTIASATRNPPRGIDSLADQIARMAPNAGMNLESSAVKPFMHIGGRQTLKDFIEYFQNKKDYDLIFVVVPNSGCIYSYVKQAAELNVGCLTQCIKERTLNKLNPQTVGNILLKVNSKLNGTNHAINGNSRPAIMQRPCMIMGADVTHPSPDAKDIPSVAAVTASHDPQAFQYNICWRLQPPKVEIIEDLCNITREQLLFFFKKNNCKPERIVFFRDGVSEGQFQEVQRAEISAIQKACKSLQKEGYEPKITFLVVQKRHHTRLFPMDSRDSEDRNMNVPAGTCVDSMITNPMMQDFYLVSHASIQGVAKPTKYCTLWDDNKLNHDDIEELTYHLCHMFTRCNRSVSYPAPTYYAHLAAARAKVYIENDKLNMTELNRHQQNYQIKECISKDKPMFFV